MDSSHIMQAIFNKYGDITKACTLQSELFKTLCLEGICKVVQKLYDTHLADMKFDDVKGFYSILRDAESLNFDVKWLHQRLDEIVKVMTSKDELKKLEDELRESKVKAEEISNALELKTIEQAKLEHDIEKLEEQNVIENLKIEELNAQIDNIKSTCLSFKQVTPGLL
ncbi:centromere-associated protein E-like [Chenopodium quinoa]|uniref:centromere-associated protein E-like n=1 Tax=Chenopodium quinoa TaxID=63459 RepID=UPI000B7833FF|nr:centromere-associated protein E-like [Chenopodium quinoa]